MALMRMTCNLHREGNTSGSMLAIATASDRYDIICGMLGI